MKANKKYYTNVKRLFPIHSKKEKIYLQQLKEQISEYDDITYEKLIDSFGEPIDVVKAYYETISSNYLLKRISIKRIIIFTCITILSITTIYFACRTYYLNEAVNEYYNSIPIEVEESIEVIE